MLIHVASKRKKRGISEPDGLAVGHLALTAGDDDDRRLISAFYRCLGPIRPDGAAQDKADRKAIAFLRKWLKRVAADQPPSSRRPE